MHSPFELSLPCPTASVWWSSAGNAVWGERNVTQEGLTQGISQVYVRLKGRDTLSDSCTLISFPHWFSMCFFRSLSPQKYVFSPISLKYLINKNAFANLFKTRYMKSHFIDRCHSSHYSGHATVKSVQKSDQEQKWPQGLHSGGVVQGVLIRALKVPLNCEVFKDICWSLHSSFCAFTGRIIPDIKRE